MTLEDNKACIKVICKKITSCVMSTQDEDDLLRQGMTSFILKLPPNHSARIRLGGWLRGRGPPVPQLQGQTSTAWGRALSSAWGLGRSRPRPLRSGLRHWCRPQMSTLISQGWPGLTCSAALDQFVLDPFPIYQ